MTSQEKYSKQDKCETFQRFYTCKKLVVLIAKVVGKKESFKIFL